LVPNERLELTVDLLRVVTSGVALSAVEHPDMWPSQRPEELVDFVLQLIGCPPSGEANGPDQR